MTNLDSILKSRDITLSTKVRLVKAVVCPVVMYGCESRTIKKAEGEKRVEPPENLDVKLNQQLFHTYVEEAFSSVQLLGRVRLCDPMDCSTPGFPSITNSQSLLELMSFKSVMPSSHLNLYRPLLLLPSIFPSIRVFSNESVLPIRWTEYWSFSFSISPSNEHSGLISFRMDWLDLLAVQS